MGFGAGGEFPGGGSSTPSGLIVPSRLVVGGPASGSAATIEIPGLSGSPDIIPASPSTFSDEFDEDAAGVPTGWTVFNAPDICNTNDALSHLHIEKLATGTNMAGIFKVPPAAPYTMTAKLSDLYLGVSTNRAGIFACSGAAPAAASGSIIDLGISQASGPTPQYYSNKYAGYQAAGSGTGSLFVDTSVNPEAAPPCYLRIVVTSTTVWNSGWSKNGLLWNVGASVLNPGFVPGCVGLMCNTVAGTGRGEAFFDWVRFS